ncbi:transglutaminase domain-containing protein [Halobellus sp. GM3]|uniref:transglutaminase domain-containing protein n=1 Tax=Halobellus sp. GM3 TaxID=3458410 RepID=UPI00403DBC4E
MNRPIASERALAFAGIAALTWSYVGVLWHVTDVVGGREPFAAAVLAALVLAALVGRFVGVRAASVLTVALLALGVAVYLIALPASQLELLTAERVLTDTVALLTGLSVLRLVGAGVWATAVVPGPVFFSWYLAARGRYVLASAVGGVALALVVLTGDADGVTTLVGVVGATVAVAASTFERHGTGFAQADVLTALLAAMIVLSSTLSVVPGAAGSPVLPDRGAPTVEGNLVDAQDRIEVAGSIRLSPAVRFTVESPRPAYWRTAAYDRYTGDGWVRTGNERPYGGRLSGHPGPARTLGQTVTAEGSISVLPAAWKPVELDGAVADRASVTPQGSLRPGTTLEPGDSYTVTSRVPNATTERLRTAGTDYPDSVTASYLQLPASTTDRVRERADAVAGEEDTPYEKAVAIETHLEREKAYSLSVPTPTGDVADTFLFEMDAGYCTYYATTMVVMLRSQGVPARFVTGYTPGERVDEGTRVVRGLDSHAWVEVYFPDAGWVRFDPTPGGPRETAEDARLAEARQSGDATVDLPEASPNTSGPTPSTPTSGETATPRPNGTASSPGATPASTPASPTPGVAAGSNGGASTPGGSVGESLPLPSLPAGRTLLVGIVAVVGLVAGARRTGVAARTSRLLAVQFQRRGDDPETDVIRAYRRLSVLLEAEYRPRRPGETPRSYLRSIRENESDIVGEGGSQDGHEGAVCPNADCGRVVALYERVRYGAGVTCEEADEAISTVNRLVRSSTPIVRRFR